MAELSRNYYEYEEIQNRVQGKHGFYVAATDRDMLVKVSSMVDKCGCVGLMDTAGRVQYLIDGRKGSPYAARRIREVAGRLLSQDEELKASYLDYIQESVDIVLAKEKIAVHLKGYRYLRFMLQQSAADPSLLRPVTKTLYPDTAMYFKVKPAHIERDIRYAIRNCCSLPLSSYANTAAICYLHDLVCLNIRCLQKQEKNQACDI